MLTLFLFYFHRLFLMFSVGFLKHT